MAVIDKVRKRFEKSQRLAEKYHQRGELGKARAEYANCARLLGYLAGLSPAVKRDELLEESKRFRQIAEGLGGGAIQASGRGSEPSDQGATVARPPVETPQRQEKVTSLVLAEKPKVRFADIAGLDEVKENIREAIIYPFIYPEEYRHFGVKPGGGILLYGPPGCGKTMLAAAAAAESDAVFISLKASDIKDKYVGESEKRIRDVFALAGQHPRAIVFFDEIDAVAGERSVLMEGHERSLVSEVLAQMDGLESKGSPLSCLVLAATNRPWDVDVALRRSGRFDVTIFIPHPDFEARQRIFELNLQDKPVSKSVSLGQLARMTEGYASAEIADICQRAARIPLRERISQRRPRRELAMSDFEQVLRTKKTVLASWYRKATKELESRGEADMFGDLVQAARDYRYGSQD